MIRNIWDREKNILLTRRKKETIIYFYYLILLLLYMKGEKKCLLKTEYE